MKLPHIQLTAAAKGQLRRLMDSIENFRPLASIVWSECGEGRYPDGRVVRRPPAWSVGFHDAAKIPEAFVVDIDGIAFALEPDSKKSLQWKEIVAVGLRPSMLAALRCNPQVRRITHNEIVSVY
jgi:hypothetical protein